MEYYYCFINYFNRVRNLLFIHKIKMDKQINKKFLFGILIFILFVLPWLDTSKVRSAIFRPIYKQFYWFLVADVIILGYMGAMPAEGTYLLIARVATSYYFVHFLVILPILGKKEKTLEVPLSITEPVIGGLPKEAMAKFKKEI